MLFPPVGAGPIEVVELVSCRTCGMVILHRGEDTLELRPPASGNHDDGPDRVPHVCRPRDDWPDWKPVTQWGERTRRGFR
jgi:hypothetical protein